MGRGAGGLLLLLLLGFALSGLPTSPAQPTAARLQDLVDAAPAGGLLQLPDGVFEEHVVVNKSLTLVGGRTTLTQASGPVLELTGGIIVVDRVGMETNGPLIRMHDAETVELRNLNGKALLAAQRVGWVRLSVPHGVVPRVAAEDSGVVHGHPRVVQVTYADGTPWAGAEVEVWDGAWLAFRGRAGADGRIGPVFIAHEFEVHRAGEMVRGLNETVARVVGSSLVFPVHAHDALALLRTELPGTGLVVPEAPAWAAPAATATGTAMTLGAAVHFHQGLRWRWLLLIAPLYMRLARHEILEHGTREAILAHVAAHPGVHFRALQRDLGLRQGTLLHHLRMLELQRFVRTGKDGMYKRYYAAGAAPTQGADPTTQRILAYIARNPGTTNAQVASALAKRPSLVHYHVERLALEGRVRKQREGRVVRIFGPPQENGQR